MFVTLDPKIPFSILAHQLRLPFPKLRSKSLGPRSLTLVRCPSTALLGTTVRASCFVSASRRKLQPHRARDRNLFRRPLPGWPRPLPEGVGHCRPAEIGSSGPSSSPDLPRRFDPLWRPGFPPRSPLIPGPVFRVAQSGIFRVRPVDNGDMAHNRGTYRQSPCRIPISISRKPASNDGVARSAIIPPLVRSNPTCSARLTTSPSSRP